MPILISLPEQNEGKEANFVCVVMTDNLEAVQNIILKKGLGVQGYSDGISFVVIKNQELEKFYSGYEILKLKVNELREAVEAGELTWHKIISWQRWDYGYVAREIKAIFLKNKKIEISSYFAKCGYTINYLE